MPWKGVTVSEQRERFLEDYLLNYYSITELARRFSISRKTAHTHPGNQGKWINWYRERGHSGFREHSRRPKSCPWQTEAEIWQYPICLGWSEGCGKGRDRSRLQLTFIHTSRQARLRKRPGLLLKSGWVGCRGVEATSSRPIFGRCLT